MKLNRIQSGNTIIFENAEVHGFSFARNVGKWNSCTGEVEVFSFLRGWFNRQPEVIRNEKDAEKLIRQRYVQNPSKSAV